MDADSDSLGTGKENPMKRLPIALPVFVAAVFLGAARLSAQYLPQPSPAALRPPQPTIINLKPLDDAGPDAERLRRPTVGPPPERGPAAPATKQRPSDSDVASVDAILAALYASVSHDSSTEPNWARMRNIFLPVGMLIPPKNPKSDMFTVLDVDGFEQRVREGMSAAKQKGDPTSFFEHEIARKLDCFGNVCQAFSTYEARRAPSDEKPFVRGINSIQMVNDGHRWWVASVVWDSERADNAIPAQYLPNAPPTVPSEYLKKN
jgi:hypothetical protein